jgi:hypothetical protein
VYKSAAQIREDPKIDWDTDVSGAREEVSDALWRLFDG